MKEYVLVHARCLQNDKGTLMVLKDRPEWQKGRLNLVGGKIEGSESPSMAAARELHEEAGLLCIDRPVVMGRIVGRDCIVYCCNAFPYSSEIKPREGETELVDWYNWSELKDDHRLMPNLKVAIPLLRMNVSGWTIVDQDSSNGMKTHHIAVEIEIPKPFING